MGISFSINIILQHPVALLHAILFLLFEHFKFRSKCSSSRAQVVEETAVSLRSCHTLHFKDVKHL
jgi:hypothetical protein